MGLKSRCLQVFFGFLMEDFDIVLNYDIFPYVALNEKEITSF